MRLGSRSVYRERSVVGFARQPKPRVEFGYLATEDPMATQIVMDCTGDTRHNFDAKNADALLRAEERFARYNGRARRRPSVRYRHCASPACRACPRSRESQTRR